MEDGDEFELPPLSSLPRITSKHEEMAPTILQDTSRDTFENDDADIPQTDLSGVMEANQLGDSPHEHQDTKIKGVAKKKKGGGSKYTALQTVRKMIIISDNTATNMLIEELGGAEILNQSFQSWGLKNTVINNSLPDLSGTNTTTSKDLINLISQINQGGLVSLKSRDRLFRIMERTQNNSLLLIPA